jgi:hypothetical protein
LLSSPWDVATPYLPAGLVRNFSDREQTNPQVSALKERIKAKS